MIDLQDLRARPELYRDAAKKKRIMVDIDAFLTLDTKRRGLLPKVEEMRARKNAVSAKVPHMKGDEKETAIREMKELAESLRAQEKGLEEIEKRWQDMQLLLPNIPLSRVPVGKDNSENKEVRREGEIPTFTFAPKDHVTLGESLGIIDIPRGVKLSGARSYFLTGDGARLHLAVLRFTMDSLIAKGWTLFLPPLMVQPNFLMGTGFFPGSEEQIFTVGVKKGEEKPVEGDNLYLIGTSEISIMGFHSEETLNVGDLPKKYCGFSSCFRREAGTYGKDTHGLYRIHQFEKVEQVVVMEADEEKSLALFEEIRRNAEDVLKALRLPYRIIDVCTGDMGKGKVFMQDIETWMPSRNAYGETHSCSYLGDFQTRRLGIKYRDTDGTKKFCHSLNNTCIASPRILIPILEIYQKKDGTVEIPEVLRPYMEGQTAIRSR